MPHNRYFCATSFVNGETVALAGEECHHLRVIRAEPGDKIELVNGRQQLATAEVIEISKNRAQLSLLQVLEAAPKKPLILALGLSKMNHLEWIIEKGTELNATAFWLFPGMLSEKEGVSDSQKERMLHLAISAMKQCGRLDLPSIEVKPPLLSWKELPGTLLFGDTDAEAPFLWDLKLPSPVPSPLIWFIGPEKGFDPRETAFLSHNLQAKGVRIHPNILRAETAPLVALTLSQTLI